MWLFVFRFWILFIQLQILRHSQPFCRMDVWLHRKRTSIFQGKPWKLSDRLSKTEIYSCLPRRNRFQRKSSEGFRRSRSIYACLSLFLGSLGNCKHQNITNSIRILGKIEFIKINLLEGLFFILNYRNMEQKDSIHISKWKITFCKSKELRERHMSWNKIPTIACHVSFFFHFDHLE